VGRIYGYDKIKPRPLLGTVETPHRNEQRFFERRLKEISTQNGFSEIRSYSFHSEKDAEVLGLKNLKHIELLNPASPEQQMLRNTLAVGILRAGRKSLSHFKEVRIFEIGKVYQVTEEDVLPKEVLSFAGGVFGKSSAGEQFYEIKGLLDTILESMGISDFYYDDNITDEEKPKGMPDLHPSRRALLKTTTGTVIGWLGEVNKKTVKYFGLKNVRGAIFEIAVDKLRAEEQRQISFQPLPKFPFVERDLSMIVPEKLKVGEVQEVLFRAGGKLLQDVDLFDLYQNKETGEKSMAFHLLFGSSEKTLKTEEVDKSIAKIIMTIEKELDVEIKK
jgi:phenylalanyl-tRNA synthetase beta chain